MSDYKQTGEDVNYHKRLAQGEKVDGQSLKPKGQPNQHTQKQSGLGHLKSKK